MVLGNLLHNGSQDVTMTTGNGSFDTGNNYVSRRSENGGSDSTTGARPNMILADIQSSTQSFGVNYFANKLNKEKLQLGHMVYQGTAGAGNAPARTESANKWTGSAVMDRLSYDQGSWLSGSEMVVLGWDPADTHTSNFWEELASVELGSTADEMDTGTFTAKKYLWIQAFVKGSGTQDNTSFRFNGDTGNNYAWRDSANGASDTTVVNYNYLRPTTSDRTNSLTNTFIVNNSANEKLLISHAVKFTTAGAGTAPERNEMVGKWANTSSQITQIKYIQFGAGDMDTGSTLKVWGHD
jgi:hypothetical protein